MSTKHPHQPVEFDAHGVIRFKSNAIVKWMLEQGGRGNRFDLNTIAMQGFTNEDHCQLAQLIGYSVSGFGDLSYAEDVVDECDALAAKLIASEPTTPALERDVRQDMGLLGAGVPGVCLYCKAPDSVGCRCPEY